MFVSTTVSTTGDQSWRNGWSTIEEWWDSFAFVYQASYHVHSLPSRIETRAFVASSSLLCQTLLGVQHLLFWLFDCHPKGEKHISTIKYSSLNHNKGGKSLGCAPFGLSCVRTVRRSCRPSPTTAAVKQWKALNHPRPVPEIVYCKSLPLHLNSIRP